jgi:general secretion pathway protein C
MAEKKIKSGGLLKSFLIYLFLVYVAFVLSDLVLMKFVRPEFVSKLNAKDKVGTEGVVEAETGSFAVSDIGSKASFTDKIVERNIFNSGKMPEPLANLKNQNNPDEEVIEDRDPVLTGLQIVLEGTIVHRNPFRSLATLTASGKMLSYAVGDEVPGLAEIISVVRKKVIFRNLKNKRLEYAEISRDQVRPKRVAVKRAQPSLKKPKGLVERDGNRFTAKRSDVNKQLSNLSQLARQANSRPARDPATGELLGYEIFAIQPGSLFENLGLKNGDIISEVNGVKISNPAKAMSMFNQLKTASEINVSINRNGSSEELEYTIED